MDIFSITLAFSLLSCSMITGFLFAYAVVVMPGIKHLEDRDFLRTFKVTDKVIQDNNPLFIIMWVGSVLSITATAFSGYNKTQGMDFWLLISATIMYLSGVQFLTIFIHLPLNKTLQKLDIDTMNPTEIRKTRSAFELRWNTFNNIRTMIAAGVSIILIILVSG